MTSNKITLHDIYEVTNRIEDKLDKVEIRVSSLEIWKAQIIGQAIVLIGIVNFAVAISFDWIKKQIFGNRI